MACKVVRCLFPLVCFMMMIHVGLGRRSIADETNPVPEKVPLNLYYEALCPGCESFVVQGLAPMFKNGLIDIVDLRLVPWGNSRVIEANKTYSCQHGPDECFFNIIEACAIDAWPTTDGHFPFINCIETLSAQNKSSEWQTCFQTLGLDPKPVSDCYFSPKGDELEQKYADETAKLKPPHKFVPWVVVDGKALEDNFDHFVEYVCKAYKGKPPRACSGALSGSFLTEETVTPHVAPICYADDKTA